MADMQSAVDTAGLGQQLAKRTAGLEAGLAEKQAALKPEQAKLQELAQQETQVRAEKEKEMQPLIAAQQTALDRPAPEAPALKKVEQFTPPKIDPQAANETFGMLMAASMLVGAASRGPYNNMMTAMTGALNGLAKGEEASFREASTTFEKNLAATKESNAALRQEFEDNWKKYQNEPMRLQQAMQLTAAKYGLHLDTIEAGRKSVSETVKGMENAIKAQQTALERSDAIAVQFNAHREAHLDRQAARDAATQAVSKPDPETVDFYAKQSLAGNDSWQVGLARGKVGQALISAVKDRIPQLAKEYGLSPQDVGTNKVEYAALTKTLADRQKYSTSVEQLQGTLTKQADLVESLLSKGAAGGQSPILNKWIQAGRKSVAGDPDVTALDVAIRGLGREHQRVLTSPLSNAQLHASAQQTADELVNLAQNPAQIRSAIKVMKQEAANGKQQAQETLTETKNRLRSIGKTQARREGDIQSFATEAEAAAAGLKPGTRVTIGGVSGTWQ